MKKNTKKVSKNGELKHASFKASKIAFATKTRGAIFKISKEAMLNNDTTIFSEIGKTLAKKK